jgi:hypothetical protein
MEKNPAIIGCHILVPYFIIIIGRVIRVGNQALYLSGSFEPIQAELPINYQNAPGTWPGVVHLAEIVP